MTRVLVSLVVLFSLTPSLALAQDATTARDVTTPYPTLEAISIEWAIDGDDDADGRVTVRYREVGGSYRVGLPLFRVPAGSNEGFSWTNRHVGSLFDLVPDTEYEIELTLVDPDGGDVTRTVTARTRPIPRAASDARVVPVTPATFASAASSAEAGDVLELAAGRYAGFTFEGDGTSNRPIVIRGASSDTVVIEGDVRLDGRRFVFVEDVTVEGMVKLNASEGIVVRGCTIRAEEDGIVSLGAGSTNGYFADNVVLGITEWQDAMLGADGANVGEGIQITGPGNVIAHNRVRGFRDAISLLEDGEAVNQTSIDIVGNDVSIGADDGIEADFAMGNVRVLRNRIASSFVGISSQPSLGGPTYFVRNVMFNVVYSPFKLHRTSVGDVVLHNTVVKCGDALGIYAGRPISRAYFRNNLFLGGTGGGTYGGYGNGDGSVIRIADADETCSFDHDGFGSTDTGRFEGRLGESRFTSLAELRASTTETNAVEVSLGDFAATITHPSSPFPEREVPDLRLREGGAAIDRGALLPNVNDGFAGDAPDLGAYELGTALPPYGPRGASTSECGNGVREDDEACDDGNLRDGDGCDASCRREAAPDVDAGSTTTDGGAARDDAGAVDGGTAEGGGGGCGCGSAGGSASGAFVGIVAWLARRRRR
jgi:cysteine-rich repeat protein